MTYLRNGTYHIDLRLDGWGRLALSTKQKNKAIGVKMETAIKAVHLQGKWHILDALQNKTLGVKAFYAAYVSDRLDDLHVGPNPPLVESCDQFSKDQGDFRYTRAMERVKGLAPRGARVSWVRDNLREVILAYRHLAPGTEARELAGVFLLIAEHFGYDLRRSLYRDTKSIRRKPTARRDRYLLPEEIDKLRDVSGDWWPMICLSLSTGIRKGELLELTPQNLDLVTGKLVIFKGKTPAAERAIPLGGEILGLLRGWTVGLGPTDKLFPVGDSTVHDAWSRIRQSVGIDITWHGLRHTWATHAAQSGMPLTELMRLGGWTNLSMVQRYAKFAPDASEYVDKMTLRMGLGGSGVPKIRPQAPRQGRKIRGIKGNSHARHG